MPLVSGLDLLAKARQDGYGVGAFNTDNMESTLAIIEAAEETRSPVMLAISVSALSYSQWRIVEICLHEAKQASVPVAIHLDHGNSFEICMACIRAGFTSVMIDKSHEDEATNIAETKRVVEVAHTVGVSVEAEIGRLGGIEDDLVVAAEDSTLTTAQEAERFMAATEADSLAIAIGTSHGPNKGKGRPFIHHERIREIAARVPDPLVMHGASGVPQALVARLNQAGGVLSNAVGIHDDDIQQAVQAGVAKVNVGTDLRIASMMAVRETLQAQAELLDLRGILKPAQEAMKDVIKQRMVVLGSSQKA